VFGQDGFGLGVFTMQGFEHCSKESKNAMRRRANSKNNLTDQTTFFCISFSRQGFGKQTTNKTKKENRKKWLGNLMGICLLMTIKNDIVLHVFKWSMHQQCSHNLLISKCN